MKNDTDETGSIRQMLNLTIGLSTGLIILGVLALILPLATGIAVSMLVVWIIFFAGIAHIVHAFDFSNSGTRLWRLTTGTIYVASSIYLASHPAFSLASLTLVLAAIFVAEALAELFVYLKLRRQTRATWILLNAIGTFVLAVLIGANWPSSSAWAVGILVGVNLLMSGITFMMFALRTDRLTGII